MRQKAVLVDGSRRADCSVKRTRQLVTFTSQSTCWNASRSSMGRGQRQHQRMCTSAGQVARIGAALPVVPQRRLSCSRLGTGQHGGSCHPRCRHGLIEQTHDRRQRKHLQLCAGGTAAPACTCSVKHWPGSVETSGVQCRKIEPVMPHMRPDVSCMPFLSAKIYDDDDHIDSAHKT